jgi:hypothetical protein
MRWLLADAPGVWAAKPGYINALPNVDVINVRTSKNPRKTAPTLARADFLVELRGFEPMAIAGEISSYSSFRQ